MSKILYPLLIAVAVSLPLVSPGVGAVNFEGIAAIPSLGPAWDAVPGAYSAPILAALGLSAGATVPSNAAVIFVDTDTFATLMETERSAIDSELLERFRAGAIVVFVGPQAEQALDLPKNAGVAFASPLTHSSELFAVKMDPFHYVERDDGTWIVPSRQFSTEISLERPEILQESIIGAAIAFAAWAAEDAAHTASHFAEEVHSVACLPGQICPHSHRDNAASQGWVFTGTDSQWYSNTEFQPRGKMNWYTKIDYLARDGNATADYYNVFTNHELVPGRTVSGWEDYRNGWMKTVHDVDYYDSTNRLIDHGPHTDDTSSTTMSFSLGLDSEGVVGLNVGVSYTKAAVKIYDYSDSSIGKQEGNHHFDYVGETANSKTTYVAKPGVTIKDTDNGNTRFYDDFRAEFVKPKTGICPWNCGFTVYQTPVKAWMWTLTHSSF